MHISCLNCWIACRAFAKRQHKIITKQSLRSQVQVLCTRACEPSQLVLISQICIYCKVQNMNTHTVRKNCIITHTHTHALRYANAGHFNSTSHHHCFLKALRYAWSVEYHWVWDEYLIPTRLVMLSTSFRRTWTYETWKYPCFCICSKFKDALRLYI